MLKPLCTTLLNYPQRILQEYSTEEISEVL